jgi:acetyl esterase/lipase
MHKPTRLQWALALTLGFACLLGTLAPVAQAAKGKGKGKKKVYLLRKFGPLGKTMGKGKQEKLKLISGPTQTKMGRGQTPGKLWMAKLGDVTFKITIEDAAGLAVKDVIARIENVPQAYHHTYSIVSEGSKGGVAFYKTLGGGAAAHGGQGYLNMVSRAGTSVIVHEAGHIFDQRARETNPHLLTQWAEAIQSDNVSISPYGDGSTHEDLAEFARTYAFCLSGGKKHLAKLKALSPKRYEQWEHTVMLSKLPGDAIARNMTMLLYPMMPPGAKKSDQAKVDAAIKVSQAGLLKPATENVSGTAVPMLDVYLPPDKTKRTGVSVVLLCGGAYHSVCTGSEGLPMVKFLNDQGIAVFMVRYRCKPYKHPVPLWDAQRAMRLARSRARSFGLDSRKIGVMGFSAGGHLAASLSVLHDEPFGYEKIDGFDNASAKPAFTCLIFPVISMENGITHRGSLRSLLGNKPDPAMQKKLSADQQVTKKTPPAFLTHAKTDPVVNVKNSELYHAACQAKGVKSEFHPLKAGKHGPAIYKGKPAINGSNEDYATKMVTWIQATTKTQKK